jgi:hypothetical protein
MEFVEIDGNTWSRIPYGSEEWAQAIGGDLPRKCEACGSPIGSEHVWLCEAERCPVCGEPLTACEHDATMGGSAPTDWSSRRW